MWQPFVFVLVSGFLFLNTTAALLSGYFNVDRTLNSTEKESTNRLLNPLNSTLESISFQEGRYLYDVQIRKQSRGRRFQLKSDISHFRRERVPPPNQGSRNLIPGFLSMTYYAQSDPRDVKISLNNYTPLGVLNWASLDDALRLLENAPQISDGYELSTATISDFSSKQTLAGISVTRTGHRSLDFDVLMGSFSGRLYRDGMIFPRDALEAIEKAKNYFRSKSRQEPPFKERRFFQSGETTLDFKLDRRLDERYKFLYFDLEDVVNELEEKLVPIYGWMWCPMNGKVLADGGNPIIEFDLTQIPVAPRS